jgi:DNA-binding transcriptional ArsR family regulator
MTNENSSDAYRDLALNLIYNEYITPEISELLVEAGQLDSRYRTRLSSTFESILEPIVNELAEEMKVQDYTNPRVPLNSTKLESRLRKAYTTFKKAVQDCKATLPNQAVPTEQVQPEINTKSADNIRDLYIIANKQRRRTLRTLCKRPMTNSALAHSFRMRQAATHRHLTILREAGLIEKIPNPLTVGHRYVLYTATARGRKLFSKPE